MFEQKNIPPIFHSWAQISSSPVTICFFLNRERVKTDLLTKQHTKIR